MRFPTYQELGALDEELARFKSSTQIMEHARQIIHKMYVLASEDKRELYNTFQYWKVEEAKREAAEAEIRDMKEQYSKSLDAFRAALQRLEDDNSQLAIENALLEATKIDLNRDLSITTERYQSLEADYRDLEAEYKRQTEMTSNQWQEAKEEKNKLRERLYHAEVAVSDQHKCNASEFDQSLAHKSPLSAKHGRNIEDEESLQARRSGKYRRCKDKARVIESDDNRDD